MSKILLVDDEDTFRVSISERLTLRGYENVALSRGDDALKAIRKYSDIDVVILDRKMPGMTGEQVLKELKHYRPELQVIMLTGHASMESAVESGRLDAYAYLEKPCEFEHLIEVVEAARRDRPLAMERHEIPQIERGSPWKWLWGSHNFRPGMLIFGGLIFLLLTFMPTPDRLEHLLTFEKKPAITDTVTGRVVYDPADEIVGYAGYSKMKEGETIVEYYGHSAKLEKKVVNENGERVTIPLTTDQAAFRAKAMLAGLAVCALFWATGAMPIGITALFFGVICYFFGVMPPDDIAAAFAKDSVIFVFGVLVVAHAISKTGLDRRIGLLLMGPATSLGKVMFIFLPLVGITCSFLSEHAIVAFLMPLIMTIYASSCRSAGVTEDKALAVMLVLSLCYAANCGGPGSPAAGGRNAVMVSLLSDYGHAPTFAEWVKYGLPFVPVMAWVIGIYFYLTFRRKVKTTSLNVSSIARQAAERIGPMNRMEKVTAAILCLLVFLWIGYSGPLGMGGPVILTIVLLTVARVITWTDVAKIQWEVVALYACATAMGKALAITGAALYMADSFVSALPDALGNGIGLAISSSFFSGFVTNFMSDGATVSAIGPITIPMAMIAGTHPWMVGLATAFASSFAHTLLIGTPNNAIAYAMAKDPVTGKQLVTIGDFLRHGAVIVLLSWAVLWGWLFLTYWRWVSWPPF